MPESATQSTAPARADAPLPRPELLERAYVLKPLADLAGTERHPLTGRTFADHWRDLLPSSRLRLVELPETGYV